MAESIDVGFFFVLAMRGSVGSCLSLRRGDLKRCWSVSRGWVRVNVSFSLRVVVISLSTRGFEICGGGPKILE